MALRKRGYAVDTHVITLDYAQADVAQPWPQNWRDYDLIVPMGSIRSLTDKASIANWVFDELELLRKAHESDTPMLGICFGGQLLSDALGGSVEKAPVGEFGWTRIEGAGNPVGPGPWMQWHHDRFTPPAEAELLAHTDEAAQLFRLGRTVGAQFHPEVNRTHIAGWLGSAVDDYLAECGIDRFALLAETEVQQAHNREQCFALVDWFLDEVAFPG